MLRWYKSNVASFHLISIQYFGFRRRAKDLKNYTIQTYTSEAQSTLSYGISQGKLYEANLATHAAVAVNVGSILQISINNKIWLHNDLY